MTAQSEPRPQSAAIGAARSSATRVAAVDIARTLALAGMVVFHFTRNLEDFALIPPGTTTQGFWWYFARGVAGSFLFLAGVSLWLAHGRGIRWRAFLRRLAVLAAAACLVTLATWIALPHSFVYFGILHSIAVASIIGLAFLHLPAAVTLAAAAGAVALSYLGPFEAFGAPWLWWIGLSPEIRPTIDFEPVFPWLAPCLAGIAAARLGGHAGLWERLARWRGPAARALGWPGRNSLAIYLVHQPVLIALIWTVTRTFG
jgi:uncharacterized membrane protein